MPVKRLSLAEKGNQFNKCVESITLKLNELRQVLTLNPMKVVGSMPKVRKMAKTTKVIGHKATAMKELSIEKKNVALFERYLDHAIAAAHLMEGIVDDALKAAKAG